MSSSHYLHKPHKQLNGFSLYFSDDLAFIVIDRGENRLNREFVETFSVMLDAVEGNESCKGLITTGTGRFYGNGLDLAWMKDLSQKDLASFVSGLHILLRRIILFPIPTLAALNGHAFAGGALLAFAHDLRTFRVDKGWICFNEVLINLRFASHHLVYIRTKIGNGKNLIDALVLGKRYTAEEAFNCGLVHAIPKENLLITESVRLLKSFCGKTGYPRDSLTNMKVHIFKDYLDDFNKNFDLHEKAKSKL